ncbi:MAG: hypothetical protein KDE45_22615 [Caldilineaceae bacterium]|nr:hypothetical protein [Caldilineaceae bacterium]
MIDRDLSHLELAREGEPRKARHAVAEYVAARRKGRTGHPAYTYDEAIGHAHLQFRLQESRKLTLITPEGEAVFGRGEDFLVRAPTSARISVSQSA